MEDLIRTLRNAEIVIKGDVNLRGGQASNFYIDVKKAYGDPKILNLLANNISKILGEETCIAAMGHGGIALATAISIQKNLPLVIVRESPKGYGQRKNIDVYLPNSKDKVAIVDDVLTTGGSLGKIAYIIEQTSAKVTTAYVVVKRGEVNLQFPIKHLIDAQSL